MNNDLIHRIVVFGATGMLGMPVARQLVRAGYEVTAMVRNPEAAAKKLGDGIRLVKGDLQHKKDIRKALEGADAVYLNLSVRPQVKKYHTFIPERDGLENVLQVVEDVNRATTPATPQSTASQLAAPQPAAPRPATPQPAAPQPAAPRPAGKIQRVAALSSLVHRYGDTDGFKWWVFEIKKWGVSVLRSATVPTTIFHPSMFMETFDQGGILQGRRLMLVGKSRASLHLVAGDDYGKMVAESFRCGDTGDQEYVIQGPGSWTLEQAALAFVRNYRHGPVSITRVPLWLMKAGGLINAELDYLAHIMEAFNNYPEKWEAEETVSRLGQPHTTFTDYVSKL